MPPPGGGTGGPTPLGVPPGDVRPRWEVDLKHSPVRQEIVYINNVPYLFTLKENGAPVDATAEVVSGMQSYFDATAGAFRDAEKIQLEFNDNHEMSHIQLHYPHTPGPTVIDVMNDAAWRVHESVEVRQNLDRLGVALRNYSQGAPPHYQHQDPHHHRRSSSAASAMVDAESPSRRLNRERGESPTRERTERTESREPERSKNDQVGGSRPRVSSASSEEEEPVDGDTRWKEWDPPTRSDQPGRPRDGSQRGTERPPDARTEPERPQATRTETRKKVNYSSGETLEEIPYERERRGSIEDQASRTLEAGRGGFEAERAARWGGQSQANCSPQQSESRLAAKPAAAGQAPDYTLEAVEHFFETFTQPNIHWTNNSSTSMALRDQLNVPREKYYTQMQQSLSDPNQKKKWEDPDNLKVVWAILHATVSQYPNVFRERFKQLLKELDLSQYPDMKDNWSQANDKINGLTNLQKEAICKCLADIITTANQKPLEVYLREYADPNNNYALCLIALYCIAMDRVLIVRDERREPPIISDPPAFAPPGVQPQTLEDCFFLRRIEPEHGNIWSFLILPKQGLLWEKLAAAP